MNYYNEIDPAAAEWLRELVLAGLIAPGEVDDRSIEDVVPADLAGFRQCHFFAGIGGWSYALRLAGWPDDRAVWTGSCPCQPFSQAGAGKGADDERHLWPAFRWLIDQCRPAVVFGEQVASKAGRGWLTGVRSDLERMGYGVGAADLCAAGVGAPHIRQRLFWVADAELSERRSINHSRSRMARQYPVQRGGEENPDRHSGSGSNGGLADSECGRSAPGVPEPGERQEGVAEVTQHDCGRINSWSDATWIPCADGKARRIKPGLEPLVDGLPGRVGLLRGYGNAIVPQVAAAFIGAFDEA